MKCLEKCDYAMQKCRETLELFQKRRELISKVNRECLLNPAMMDLNCVYFLVTISIQIIQEETYSFPIERSR